ncbi:MAG: phage major capsid protein, partial [Gammaproteobacteria bacterium]|nr:phage major capsid protein [Gammaproteobacteria bacterium]
DWNGNCLDKGCLDASLKASTTIPMLWSHNDADVIGEWEIELKNGDTLMGEGPIFSEISRGVEAVSLIKREAVKGISIGGWIENWTYDEDDDVMRISELRLMEASIVLNPADENAQIDELRNKMVRAHKEKSEKEDPEVKDDPKEVVVPDKAMVAKVTRLQRAFDDYKADAGTKIRKLESRIKELIEKAEEASGIDRTSPLFARTAHDIKWKAERDEQGGVSFELPLDHRMMVRAVTSIDSTPGAAEGHAPVWFEPLNMNPFRPYCFMNRMTAPSAQVPKGELGTFAARSTHGSRTYSGSLTEKQIQANNAELAAQFTEESFDDVMGLDAFIAMAMVQEWTQYEGTITYDAIKTSAVANSGHSTPGALADAVQFVKTDVDTTATTALTTALADDRLNALYKAVPQRHRARGAVWIISRAMEALVHELVQGTNGDYWFDPRMGVDMIRGHPVVISDILPDNPSTKNDIYAIFGSFQGVWFSVLRDLYVRRYTETEPGTIIVLGRARVTADVINGTGLAALLLDT